MLPLTSAAVVAAVALLVPLALRLTHLRLPDIVVQLLAGVVLGPQLLGWVEPDQVVRVFALVGLGFLLLLAGLEVDLTRFRGRVLRLTAMAYAASAGLALVAGIVFRATGVVQSATLVAVILAATSLGIVLPVLEDAGQAGTPFGQAVVAGASIAEVVPIVLLSLRFSSGAAGPASQAVLFAVFVGVVAVVVLGLLGLRRSPRVTGALLALQDTTAQIRVRGAFALLMLFAVLASLLGLEVILGAFLAGLVLRAVDRDEAGTHTEFHSKLHAVGYGVFVPFFFVSTGTSLDVRSLLDPATLLHVPLFLVALLVVRAVPALLYAPLASGRRQLVAAGLLQATSLSIPVVAGAIGVQLGLLRPGNYVALVGAGLASVLAFPVLALPWLQSGDSSLTSPSGSTVEESSRF